MDGDLYLKVFNQAMLSRAVKSVSSFDYKMELADLKAK